MVTIANYLNGNFATKEANELERPICMLSGADEDIRTLWNYSTNKNINMQRNIVIVDFGITWVKKLAVKHSSQLIEKRQVIRISEGHHQHVILPGRSADSLANCVSLLESHIKTHNLVDLILFVQGIIAIELFHNESQIEKFIGQLSAINPAYKQINILAGQGLDKKTKYDLQRLSTCIINVNKNLEKSGAIVKLNEGKWEASMVVRRYTGFSHQEDYEIQIKQDKLKVQKLKREVPVEQQQSHLDGIGFTVKKSAKIQELEQIKNIIYPYLNKQVCSNCKASDCACQQPAIVLDDEQEEQDDVDV